VGGLAGGAGLAGATGLTVGATPGFTTFFLTTLGLATLLTGFGFVIDI
jgi:hypothetical protein